MNNIAIIVCLCLIGTTIYLAKDIKQYIKECIDNKANEVKIKDIQYTALDMQLFPKKYMTEEEIKEYNKLKHEEEDKNKIIDEIISFNGNEYLEYSNEERSE